MKRNSLSLWTLAAALLFSLDAGAEPISPIAQTRFQAASLEIDAGDTVTEHLCPSGYLVSVTVHNGTANIPIAFVDRHHTTAPMGKWLPNAAGFRLRTASLFTASVQMICSMP